MAHRTRAPKTGFPRIIEKSFKMEHLKKLSMLEQVKVLGVEVIRLPAKDFAMAGRKTHTEEVLGYKMHGQNFEIHFDENFKINNVYWVK